MLVCFGIWSLTVQSVVLVDTVMRCVLKIECCKTVLAFAQTSERFAFHIIHLLILLYTATFQFDRYL